MNPEAVDALARVRAAQDVRDAWEDCLDRATDRLADCDRDTLRPVDVANMERRVRRAARQVRTAQENLDVLLVHWDHLRPRGADYGVR